MYFHFKAERFLLSLFSFILLLFTVTTHSSNMNISHYTVYSHVTDSGEQNIRLPVVDSQSYCWTKVLFLFTCLKPRLIGSSIHGEKNEEMKRNYQFWGNISTRAPVWWCLRVSFRESLTLHSCQDESFMLFILPSISAVTVNRNPISLKACTHTKYLSHKMNTFNY